MSVISFNDLDRAAARQVFDDLGEPATYISPGGVACPAQVIFSQEVGEIGGFESTSEKQRIISFFQVETTPSAGGFVQVSNQRFALIQRVDDDNVESQWKIRLENG